MKKATRATIYTPIIHMHALELTEKDVEGTVSAPTTHGQLVMRKEGGVARVCHLRPGEAIDQATWWTRVGNRLVMDCNN
jgi:hypothetical protein